MKKNISINIGGIIFHIEEDGYDNLRKYLDSVNRYFASFDDSSEILADIEGRIAEIFLSRLNEGKQIITAEDVSSLIATMGSVNDFKAAEEKEFAAGEPAPASSQTKQQSSASSEHKRLYRDKNRKILGGVCSGLGHYFNIDPVWPRLIFALLLFAYAFALIVYIVLWIFLPATELEEEPTMKKMYRNPDKKVIGGVAAGIAAFFGTDISVVRLLFVGMTFFFGTGFFLYIILWIVLPEARTITEKMKMQGEPVTLSNIESTIKKGLNEESAAEESQLSKIILFPFRALAAFINWLASGLGPILKMIVDVVRVAIGLVFTLTGVIMIITLIMAFGIVIGMFNLPEWSLFSDWYVTSPNFPLAAIRNSFPTWTVVFTFLAGLIPALFVLLIGNSIMAGRIVLNQTAGWSLFAIFFISAIVISFSVPQLVLGFKEEGEYKTEETFSMNGKTPVLNINETGLDDYDVTSLTLKGYDGKDIQLIERFQSQGPSRKVAAENAQMVEYKVVQNDSILTFDSNISFKKDAKFRAQRLDVDVMVPYNQPMVIDASLWRLIDTHVISYRSNFRDLNLETQTWKMTDKGLQCITCPQDETESIINAHDQFGFKDFNAVALSGAFRTTIQKGDAYAVEVKGPESQKKLYDIYLSGETLVIDYNNTRKSFWKKPLISSDEVTILITMPSLHELDATGAGKLKFVGFDEDEVEIKLTGAVMGDGELNANTLNVKLTGASMLSLQGKGKFMNADIIGASGLKAYGYEVGHCVVEAHGASSAKVNVTGTLEVTEGIASSVSHKGNPEIIKR